MFKFDVVCWSLVLAFNVCIYLLFFIFVIFKGNFTLKSQSVPSLYSAVREAAKMVPNPNPTEVAAGRKTVFDTWLWANPDLNDATQPRY